MYTIEHCGEILMLQFSTSLDLATINKSKNSLVIYTQYDSISGVLVEFSLASADTIVHSSRFVLPAMCCNN